MKKHTHAIHVSDWWRTRRGHDRQRHPRRFFWFRIGGALRILLEPGKEPFIVGQLHVDQKVSLSIVATDVAGNPVKFAPDAAPVWANSNPAAADMTVSNDGLTATLIPKADAVGQVTSVSLAVVIGGVTFTATDDISIVEGAIAGVKIVESFSPNP